MSAMLRAHKAGGSSAGKNHHARSYSLSGGSDSGSDSEDTGARLSAASVDESPARVRFSSIAEELGHLSVASSVVSGNSGKTTQSAPFQLGEKPSGDVFSASPVKAPRKKLGHDLASAALAAQIGEMAVAADETFETNDDCRMMPPVSTSKALAMGPREDRVFRRSSSRYDAGGLDAQGLYPSSACVFIANLPESKDDRALEAAITREFGQFGTVFVKIRREMKGGTTGMPYAFAQYTNDADANVAVEEGKGIMILGRPCRTEMVKANRTFVIYSRHGDEITVDIAREILEPYGELSKCEMMNFQMQQAMGLPTAVLVEFAKFDPKRDLNSALRQHGDYHIDACEVKKRNLVSRTDADEEFLHKYDVDRRSVFVGNLPLDTTKEELMDLFAPMCDVVDANVVARPNYYGNHVRTFAFVEFARADMPDRAIEVFNETRLRGSALKVQRKVFKHMGTPRRIKSQAFSIRSSTTPKTPGSAMGRSPMPSSIKRELNTPGSQYGYNSPAVGSAFAGHGYPAPSPAGPANGQPVLGAGGMPMTPSAFGPNPFSYTGGYWPGMSIAQDPVTGHTFWAYTPPVGGPAAPPADTPTRAASGEHQFFHGA
ncbi:hypothetical protein C8A05DRAFT_13160 [Staphylotrichum tortipilum]|uniref:RRM domain-containing protein n=1 Tax=Staphylotrichum tortipilum TaxID=2831512 RepID=A0AAN6RWF7_9PEZI|nr:hypothetical protein C8A05DRAFT_13160 [Staphylotrichum longicolle]